ncbi:MAG: hypothetical protein GC185_04920 [Alphaproteobacteria bacterium]|nr:hypothetical protein [Alphaproteobacteria bacterium]
MKEEFNNASPPGGHTARLDAILQRLARVPEGKEVADFLAAHKVQIHLKDDTRNHAAASTLLITGVKNGRYSYKTPEVILQSELSDDNILQALVHEAQHIRQHLSGVGNPDRILDEADAILFYRLQEADAQAAATQVAWRLKLAGDDAPWEAAKQVGYEGICDAFEKIATQDPSSLDDGRAKRVAFDAWFAKDSRLAHYNQHTVDLMVPFLAKGRDEIFKDHGMVNAPLDAEWLEKLHGICPLPYLLQPGAADILTDPAYRRDMHLRPPAPEVESANDNGTQTPVIRNKPKPSGPKAA